MIVLLVVLYLGVGFALAPGVVRVDGQPLGTGERIFTAVVWPILVLVTVFDRKE